MADNATMKKHPYDIAGLDTDNLTQEERSRIYTEMDHVLNQSKIVPNKNRFSISNAPTGVKLPLVFNIILLVASVVIILSTVVLLNQRASKEQRQTLSSANNTELAQSIILQKQAELESQNEEIEEIRLQLEKLQNETPQYKYEIKIAEFKAEFEDNLATQQAELRARLLQNNATEAEIRRQLNTLEETLTNDFNAEFATYQREQEEIRLAQEEEYNEEIRKLESQYSSTQETLKSLEEEISSRTENLRAENQEITDQLLSSQIKLKELEDAKSDKKKVFEKFNIYHQNIITLVKNQKFADAQIAINEAIADVNNSDYSNDVEAIIYKDTYQTYNAMITAAVQSEKILNDVNTDNQKLIDTKDQQIQELKDAQNLQISNLNDWEEKFNDLNTKYTQLLRKNEQLDNQLSRIQGKTLRETLTNIRLIITYLQLKQAGTDNANTKAQLLSIAEADPLYFTIINRIIEIIDPSKQLQF